MNRWLCTCDHDNTRLEIHGSVKFLLERWVDNTDEDILQRITSFLDGAKTLIEDNQQSHLVKTEIYQAPPSEFTEELKTVLTETKKTFYLLNENISWTRNRRDNRGHVYIFSNSYYPQFYHTIGITTKGDVKEWAVELSEKTGVITDYEFVHSVETEDCLLCQSIMHKIFEAKRVTCIAKFSKDIFDVPQDILTSVLNSVRNYVDCLETIPVIVVEDDY